MQWWEWLIWSLAIAGGLLGWILAFLGLCVCLELKRQVREHEARARIIRRRAGA